MIPGTATNLRTEVTTDRAADGIAQIQPWPSAITGVIAGLVVISATARVTRSIATAIVVVVDMMPSLVGPIIVMPAVIIVAVLIIVMVYVTFHVATVVMIVVRVRARRAEH